MQVSETVAHFIDSSKRWKFIAIVLAISLVKTGIWYIPNFEASRLIALNPFTNPFRNWPDAHYLYWSWLGSFLAWTIGATGKWSFFLFHLLFSLAFTALALTLIFRRFSERQARTALILFSVLPASTTSYFWVSMDSITLFLMLLVIAIPRWLPMAFLIGVALGMQHFEQSFVGMGGVAFALLLAKRYFVDVDYSPRWALSSFAGIITGKIFLVKLFAHLGASVNSGRMYWVKGHLPEMLHQFAFHWQYIIYSSLGLGWIVVIKYTEKRKAAIPFLFSLGCMMLLLPISGDQTRVLAIVTFPLLAVFILFNKPFVDSIDNTLRSWLFLTWLVLPYVWVWGGNPRWSVFPYDVVWTLHRLFGWFSVPANQATWPF